MNTSSRRRISDVPTLGQPGTLLLGVFIGAIGTLAWVWALIELVHK